MRGVSIDIGYRNLAILVEDFDETKTGYIQKNMRYRNNKEPTDEMNKILNCIYKNGNIIFIEKKDFWEEKDGKFITCKSLISLAQYLKTLQLLFLTCDFVLIEKQMKNNNNARRIEAHIESFLINLFIDNNRNTDVIIYPSSNKTRVLGAPWFIFDDNNKKHKMTKPERKKWSSELMRKILLMRKDITNFNNVFVEHKKPDDISDCETMLQSFKFKILYDGYKLRQTNNTLFSPPSINSNLNNFVKELYNGETIYYCKNGLCMFKCFFNHIFFINQEDIYKGKWCKKCIFEREKNIVKYYSEKYNFNFSINDDYYKHYKFINEKETNNVNVSSDELLFNQIKDKLKTNIEDFTTMSIFKYNDKSINDTRKKMEKYNAECISKMYPNENENFKLLIKCQHGNIQERTKKELEKCCRKTKYKCGCKE